MRHITLGSLLLAMDDLLIKRLGALQSFANGAANEKLITALRNKIAALPAVLTSRPLADELDTADARHDGSGAALWFLIEAYLRHPDTTPAMIEAGKKIREALISELDDLTATYEKEAKAAKDHKDALAGLQNELSLFPVLGGTLYDWAIGFVTAGEQLDVLLSQRADAKDRAAAGSLRMEAVGVINRLRKNLAAEMKADPSLPATLDGDVFAYFDLLEAKAAEEAKAKAKVKVKVKEEPKVEPAAPKEPAALKEPENGQKGKP